MKTYTEEFKKTIVELYENGNKNKSELAREYGTSEGNVRAWIKKYGKIKKETVCQPKLKQAIILAKMIRHTFLVEFLEKHWKEYN